MASAFFSDDVMKGACLLTAVEHGENLVCGKYLFSEFVVCELAFRVVGDSSQGGKCFFDIRGDFVNLKAVLFEQPTEGWLGCRA